MTNGTRFGRGPQSLERFPRAILASATSGSMFTRARLMSVPILGNHPPKVFAHLATTKRPDNVGFVWWLQSNFVAKHLCFVLRAVDREADRA